MFAIFLFLTYYLEEILRYSPVVTGVAFLPMIAALMHVVDDAPAGCSCPGSARASSFRSG